MQGILLSTALFAGWVTAGQAEDTQPFELQAVGAEMTVDEYRQASRNNQKQIRHFVTSYSESTLLSLGLPNKGIHLMGAVVGAAATQNATLYLNDEKSFAIDIKDAAQDDRAIYFGFKLDW
jgi:hypothetical protein